MEGDEEEHPRRGAAHIPHPYWSNTVSLTLAISNILYPPQKPVGMKETIIWAEGDYDQRCVTCHEIKPLSEFKFRTDSQSYRRSCADCEDKKYVKRTMIPTPGKCPVCDTQFLARGTRVYCSERCKVLARSRRKYASR